MEEPKIRGRPQTNLTEPCKEPQKESLNKTTIRVDNNFRHEVAISIIKTTSKIYKLGSYDEAVNALIYSPR